MCLLPQRGASKVDRVYHAYRGAENFVNKLKKIGVKIKVLKNEKKYLAKIIALDINGLSTISAIVSGAKVLIADIKYLPSNEFFYYL